MSYLKDIPPGLPGAGIRSLSQLVASASCKRSAFIGFLRGAIVYVRGVRLEDFEALGPRTDRKERIRATGRVVEIRGKYDRGVEREEGGGGGRRKETTKESTWS